MKKKNNDEKLIHVRLDSSEALESKKDLLHIEANLIIIAQAIKRYKQLKLKEAYLKAKLDKELMLAKTNLRRLKISLPKLELPRIVKQFEHKKDEEEKKGKIKAKKEKKSERIKKKGPEEDLEAQLREIQEKLNRLG